MSSSDDIFELEMGATANDPITLPSTPPFEVSPDHAGVVRLEPDEEVDFHIPLMTSLFYQASPQHRNINRRLHRCEQVFIAIERKADL
jgi:hypothetical protein